LLTHTSGLPHKYAADGIIEREKAVQAVLALPLGWKVGEGYHYSNDGYNLLAAIVEVASKRTFEDYLRKDIFNLAELNNTGLWGYEDKTLIGVIAAQPESILRRLTFTVGCLLCSKTKF
jgi:CubicO group peptidase (beta-lactamase class C family)